MPSTATKLNDRNNALTSDSMECAMFHLPQLDIIFSAVQLLFIRRWIGFNHFENATSRMKNIFFTSTNTGRQNDTLFQSVLIYTLFQTEKKCFFSRKIKIVWMNNLNFANLILHSKSYFCKRKIFIVFL